MADLIPVTTNPTGAAPGPNNIFFRDGGFPREIRDKIYEQLAKKPRHVYSRWRALMLLPAPVLPQNLRRFWFDLLVPDLALLRVCKKTHEEYKQSLSHDGVCMLSLHYATHIHDPVLPSLTAPRGLPSVAFQHLIMSLPTEDAFESRPRESRQTMLTMTPELLEYATNVFDQTQGRLFKHVLVVYSISKMILSAATMQWELRELQEMHRRFDAASYLRMALAGGLPLPYRAWVALGVSLNSSGRMSGLLRVSLERMHRVQPVNGQVIYMTVPPGFVTLLGQ